MSFVLRFFMLCALAAPVLAHDVVATLEKQAREAGVTLIVDRAVTGTVNIDGLNGSPLERLTATAERAGLVVTRAEPVGGKTVMVVRAGGPRTLASPWSPEQQERSAALARAAALESAADGTRAAHKRTHAGHTHAKVARSRRARRAAAQAAPPPRPVQLDVMVAAAVPGTVAELAAIGHELAPVAGACDHGTQFLDGVGPGLKVLAFDRVEPRLNEHLPWGEVGACRPGLFRIRSRQKVIVAPGGSAQVPLDESCLVEEPSHREAVVKEALVVSPEALPDGRVRVTIARKRGVAFPCEPDAAVAVGGRTHTTVDVAVGQEVVVAGLGLAPVPPAHEHVHVDPLERYRRPRLLDRDRGVRHAHDHAHEPGELLVRVLVRRVPAGP